ncbi:MAG TPA: hypothetical protein VFB43_03155 [Terracidiphilus sp.]|jgi:hypothetical protein|nr:hypothetical protein [Terracidiphilus sp.]
MPGTVTQNMESTRSAGVSNSSIANGAGAAAVLAAGIGAFAVGLIAALADKSSAIKTAMIFWKPTGPLSGVTMLAIVIWLVAWIVLHALWRNKSLSLGRINVAALCLLALGLLLTFPPIVDLL